MVSKTHCTVGWSSVVAVANNGSRTFFTAAASAAAEEWSNRRRFDVREAAFHRCRPN